MKAFILAILVVGMLDAVVNHSDGLRACCAMVEQLIHHTQRDVSGSVYRS